MTKRLVLVGVLAACGGGSGGGADAQIDASATFQALITSPWSLQPGSEVYQCATLTIPRDMYISELRPIAPLGTHHTVVNVITNPTASDNPGYVCSMPFELPGTMIYGSGVGSVPFVYPDGIALHLRAGSQIHINLHLFNTGDSVLTGTSGVEVKETSVASVMHEARFVISGQATLSIPPGTSTQTGTCTLPSDVAIISYQPHMHQLGTHQTYTVTPASGAPFVLFDSDYTFDGQRHVMMDPIVTLHAGDQVKIDCTYNNTTTSTVTFGESTTDEMCFAGMSIYPYNASYCGT
ncbi:MAG TPA: hypothetical protein VL326_22090 [Kofleriaceae bacterium]|nr:hypothetical protein [Kofleriaceae bacterium]